MKYITYNTVSSIAVLRACAQATKATDMLHKHGAVICTTDAFIKHKIKVLATGYNKKGRFNHYLSSIKTDSRYSIHAEMDCLRSLLRKKTGFNHANLMMLVVRFKDGKLMNSKPCNICMKKLKDSLIDYVWYSGEDGLIRVLSLSDDVDTIMLDYGK